MCVTGVVWWYKLDGEYVNSDRWTYSKSPLSGPGDGPAVQQHLLENHLTGILHTQGNHSKAVSHKDHVHAGMIGDMCTWEVVRRDHGDWFALFMQGPQGTQGDLLARIGRRGAKGGMRAVTCLNHGPEWPGSSKGSGGGGGSSRPCGTTQLRGTRPEHCSSSRSRHHWWGLPKRVLVYHLRKRYPSNVLKEEKLFKNGG